MIKALKAMAIGLPIVAATLMTAPTSASAAPGDCPRSYFCAWADDGFSGHRAQWEGNDSDWWGDGMHDNAESVKNAATSSTTVPDNVVVYMDVNYGRADICVRPGETFDAGMDDNDYDSHQWIHSCV